MNIKIIMINSYFKFIRSGINTTYQDKGRENLYHIGIPYSGAMDNRNFLIANKLVNNNLNAPVLEFAYQGPHLKYQGDTISIAITGDVIFKIIKNGAEYTGNCYESYQIENGDEIDIISTNKTIYGYLAIGGEIDIKFQWKSCSINTNAKIGSNNGKKLENNQTIKLLKLNSNKDKKFLCAFELLYFNSSSAKVLMRIFDMFEEFAKSNGHSISVIWRVDEEDDNMRELGEEFAEDIENIKFEIVNK